MKSQIVSAQLAVKNEQGFTFIEILIAIALLGLIGGSMIYGLIKYRNDVEVDIVVDEMLASINFARNNAVAGRNRSPYGVVFFTDHYINFEGSAYNPSDSKNKRTDMPRGLYLDTTCTQYQNNTVVFSTIKGENNNDCDVEIGSNVFSGTIATIEVRRLGTIRVIR